ncbi:MAG: threonine ammonia-lyase [bacterium]|nr:threonine ammonia-lyase [bacterium]
MPQAIELADIERAKQGISRYLQPTPLYLSSTLSEFTGKEIYIKWESKLKSGAFKERGALNVLLNLNSEQAKAGVCAASAGNHALGLSLHANKLGIPCTIVMPKFAPLVKIQACEKAKAKVILHGSVFDDALEYALQLSEENKTVFVHPFNNPLVMAGQGTIGLEILDQLPSVEAIIVPVGGGGLISGVSTAIKSLKSDTYILGVQSEWAVSYQNGLPQKNTLVAQTTIADGIAVKRIGDLTAPIIKSRVDSLTTVNEDEIARAIVKLMEYEKSVAEGAGAASLAALLKGALPEQYNKIVLCVCGGNIDINLLSTIIQRDLVERGRRLKIMVTVPDRPGQLNQVSGAIAELGSNVLDLYHDRFYCKPGMVDMVFMLEVRDRIHGDKVVGGIEKIGFKVVRHSH